MRFVTVSVCLVILFLGVTACMAKSWNGITPLKSNRQDVEKVLGPSDSGSYTTYKLKDYRVNIWFTGPRCKENEHKKDSKRWDVPPGTVEYIAVTPNRRNVLLSDLDIELSKFRKEKGSRDVQGDFLFINETEGLTIQAINGVVAHYFYGPAKEDDRMLCGKRSSPRIPLPS